MLDCRRIVAFSLMERQLSPRAGWEGSVHRLVSLVAPLVLVLLMALPVAAAAVVTPDPTPDPILLVHGYRGTPSTWNDMKVFLQSKGRTVEAIALPSQDNVKNAQAILDFVRSNGWTSVDLVGQSMGGLSARYFTKSIKSFEETKG